MFGIEDPGIWSAYLLAFGCLVFSVGYGIVYWNKDNENENHKENKNK